jgi:2-iminobutanoate/2-iminopropanoate deaminase
VGARRAIEADGAPEALGPYSQGVVAGGLLFCAGQIGLEPESGELVKGGAGDETTRCLRNLSAVCEAAGTSLDRAARLTVYTKLPQKFAEINEAYGAFFESEPPARATIGVSELPMGAMVEIDAIVALD